MFRWQTNFYIIGEILKIDKRERLVARDARDIYRGPGALLSQL